MNSIDIYFLVLSVVLFVFGLKGGFLRTFCAVLLIYPSALIAMAAGTFMGDVYSRFASGGVDAQSGRALIFIIFFIILVALSEILLGLLKGLVSITILGPLDIWIGGLLGVVRALLIGAAICDMMIVLPIQLSTRDAINSSVFRSYGEQLLRITFPIALSSGPAVQKFFVKTVVPVVASIKPPSLEAINSVVKLDDNKTYKPAIAFTEIEKKIASVEVEKNLVKRFTP